jgi:hypothetical protein
VKAHQEQPFEDLIEAALLARGWQKLPRDGYDKARAPFPDVVLGFLRGQWGQV